MMHLSIHTCWLALAVLPCLALAQAQTTASASDPRVAMAPLHYSPVFFDAPPVRQIQETPDRLWLEVNREVQAGAVPMGQMGQMGQMGHAHHPDMAPAAQPPMPMQESGMQSPPMPSQTNSGAGSRQGAAAPHHHHGD